MSRGQDTAEGRWWWRSGSRRLPAWVGFIVDVRSVARRRLADALAASDGADVIVANELAVLLGWQASRRHATPLVRVRLCPRAALGARPAGGPAAPAGVAGGAAVAGVGAARQRPAAASAGRAPEPPGRARRARAERLQPRRARHRERGTGATSPATGSDRVRPRRAAAGRARAVPGAGPAPVAIGFGSMGDSDPAATATLAVTALAAPATRRAARRAVSRVQAAGSYPRSMLWVGAVDHEWLFPRCAAVVHHGGAGTVAAVLRAGLPSVVVPHMIDQYTWGRRLRELGAAAAPIPRRRLTRGAPAEGADRGARRPAQCASGQRELGERSARKTESLGRSRCSRATWGYCRPRRREGVVKRNDTWR